MTDIHSIVTTTVTLGSGVYGTTLTVDSDGSVLPNSFGGTTSVGANAIDIPILASVFVNNGTVVGAMGGAEQSGFDGSIKGGNGGIGVDVSASAATLTNTGDITGGFGGANAGTNYGGTGGIAVSLGAATLTNSGTITGGAGDFGAAIAGLGGDGVTLTTGGSLNNTGTIIGGVGGSSNAYTGAGGAGVYVKGGSLTAAGEITGGNGGISELTATPKYAKGGSGGAGVFIDGGTVTASGTISGGQAGEDNAAGVTPGVMGDAVQFGSAFNVAPTAGTLVVDPSAVFNGQVAADSRVNDTLELGGNTAATLTGLGTQFTNFSTLDFASGSRWTVDAVSAAFANPIVPVVTPVLAIQGFNGGDVLDITDFSSTGAHYSFNATTDVLTLTNASSTLNLHLTGSFGSDAFVVNTDGGAGTDVRVASAIRGTVNASVTLGSAAYPGNVFITSTGVVSPTTLAAPGAPSEPNGVNVALAGASLTNAGIIRGAAGAPGYYIGYTGGAGVKVTAGSAVNSGTIAGGAGAAGGNNVGYYVVAGSGGAGGDGDSLSGGGTFINTGNITGGKGGAGGTAGANRGAEGLGGNGGAGVYIDGGTFTNAGTITGSSGGSATLNTPGAAGAAVQFGPLAGTLIVDPGAVFNGQVAANSTVNDTLELAGTTAATLNSLGTQFIGFSTLDFGTGSKWAVDAASSALTPLTLDGLGVGDSLDITDFSSAGANYSFNASTDVLTLSNATSTLNLKLGAPLSGEAVVLSAAGNGTDLTLTPAVTGTVAKTIFVGSAAYPSPVTVIASATVEPPAGTAAAAVEIGIANATLNNRGALHGSSGAAANPQGGSGGSGVYLTAAGGTINNSGSILGGTGGYGSNRGGTGGLGVDLTSSDALTGSLLNNSGSIAGGVGGLTGIGGGYGGAGISDGNGVTIVNSGTIAGGVGGVYQPGSHREYVAGRGGDGIDATGASLTNTSAGHILGAAGGAFATTTRYLTGGAGGTAITLNGGSLTNAGSIAGGAGSVGDARNAAGYGGGGDGGAGLGVIGAATVTTSGSINGGAGGFSAFQTGGNGGVGAYVITQNGHSGSLTNTGTIRGGDGGYSFYTNGSNGGTGVYLNGGTLTNASTIAGGSAGGSFHDSAGAPGDAVQFGPTVGTLVVDPGAVFDGQVAAKTTVNDILELAGTTAGTLSGFGTQFTGFSTLDFAAGSQWTVNAVTAAFTSQPETVSGFSVGDQIDFTNFAAAGAQIVFNSVNDVLTLTGHGVTMNFTIGNPVAGEGFVLAANGAGSVMSLTPDILSTALNGTLTPGVGATGDPSPFTITSTGSITPGTGTDAVDASAANSVIANAGSIQGGAGSGQSGVVPTPGGNGGIGVDITGVGSLLTNTGNIAGGAGGSGDVGGAGGIGAIVTSSTLFNSGSISGGGGGLSEFEPTGVNGVTGIYFNGGTLTNAGTISGGAGGFAAFEEAIGAEGDAVQFGAAAGTLVVDPGAVFNGNVAANTSVNDTLELAGTTASTLSGFGTQFSGFSTLKIDSGFFWTVDATTAAFTGHTLSIQGALDTTFDIANFLPVGATERFNTSTDVLTLTSGATTLNLQFTNSYAGDSLVLSPDAGTGTDLSITDQVINFSSSVGAVIGSAAHPHPLLTVTATGSVAPTANGTDGVDVQLAGATLNNAGQILGAAGLNNTLVGQGNGNAGAGVTITAAATLTNTGRIAGGVGGYNVLTAGNGGTGIDAGALTHITNSGSITAGAGGTGGHPGGLSGTGGNGGDGVDLTVTGSSLQNSGSITAAAGGTGADRGGSGGIGVDLAAAGTSLTNTGSIVGGRAGYGGFNPISAGAGLVLAGDTSATNSGHITAGSQSSLVAETGVAGAVVSTGATLVNTGFITGGVQYAGLLSSATGGAGVYVNGGTLTNAGTISGGLAKTTPGVGDALSGGYGNAVTFGASAATLIVESGAVFQGQIVGNGVNDTLELLGGDPPTLSGFGTQFTGFSTLEFAPGAQWSVDGTLSGFAGTSAIQGFTLGDSIDITDLSPGAQSSFNAATDVLSITQNNHSYNLHFNSSVNGDSFVFTAAPGGGTDVSVACYRRGTRILTAQGEQPIETIKIGDQVQSLSGTTLPVRWIGRRSYSANVVAGDRDILPIRLRANSLGGLPRRDLWVSPEHALYLDGLLIAARDLVNGDSIVQEEVVDEVTYFHLEFDTHTVIYAEGAPAESFVDDDSRAMFDNADEYVRLYPQAVHKSARFIAPRIDEGHELQAVRQRVAGQFHRSAIAAAIAMR